MSNSLYITATEARSGKSAVALGVMQMLLRKVERVCFFRPIINSLPGSPEQDNDIALLCSQFNLDQPYEQTYGFTRKEARALVSLEKMVEGIMEKYNQLKETCDFVLCEGTDFAESTAAFEVDINAEISKNLGSPVLLVANAHEKSADDVLRPVELALRSLQEKGCQTTAVILNRIQPRNADEIIGLLRQRGSLQQELIYALPEEPFLNRPTMNEIAKALGARVLWGQDQLNRHVHTFTVAAMQLQNLLPRISRGSLIITPGDRTDVIVGCLAALSSSMENIAGILLTGGLVPEEPVWRLIKTFRRSVPILSVEESTFHTATVVDRMHATITADDQGKITKALGLFEKHVDLAQLSERVITTAATVITPKMFEYELLNKARTFKQHIVLPEGEEGRILKAAEILLHRGVVNLTLLGNEERIRQGIAQLGLQLEGVVILDPRRSILFDDFAEEYFALRHHRGITYENAEDAMREGSFFGTMMVHKGLADGMVSGAVHSTADTIRPAFEIIKTKPGISLVSSVFFMCVRNRVLVYGDCAVNPNPTPPQLAEIALSSAHTAQSFGIEPIVAMLSYSTGESGKGEEVDKVREATRIAKEMAKKVFPDLKIEGPIQYDAAVDPEVARTKMPKSEVAGNATVFIFPDLNTGNNTYKAVQRSAGAVAIGPVLQGLNRPVNDLSRGCTVTDIVNTVAITAIQAQSEKGLR